MNENTAMKERLEKMRRSNTSSEAAKPRTLALPSAFDVPLDPPAPTERQRAKLPSRPVETSKGGRVSYVNEGVEKRGFALTGDDMDTLWLVQENDFAAERILHSGLVRRPDGSLRSLRGFRQRLHTLVEHGFLQQVKSPYDHIVYRITQQGVNALIGDAKMPLRHYDPHSLGDEAHYTHRCTVAHVVAMARGGMNNDLFFSKAEGNSTEGRLAVLSSVRILQAFQEMSKQIEISPKRLFEDQKRIFSDVRYPTVEGPINVEKAVANADDVLRWWMGSTATRRDEPIVRRAWTLASIDDQGLWTPDFCILLPKPQQDDTSEVIPSVVPGIVKNEYESEEIIRRKIKNLFYTQHARKMIVAVPSKSIGGEVAHIVRSMEESSELPEGALAMFHFPLVSPINSKISAYHG